MSALVVGVAVVLLLHQLPVAVVVAEGQALHILQGECSLNDNVGFRFFELFVICTTQNKEAKQYASAILSSFLSMIDHLNDILFGN